MSKKVSPTMIGTFIVGGIIIFIVGLIVFGTGHFFSEKQMYVLYFEGDIKGLSVGAPVAFRGVRIGRVKSIKVIFNQKDLTIRIPVIIEIQKKKLIRLGGTGKYNKPLHEILIDRGLRAQLQVQNLVTGQLMIALDFHPDTPKRLVSGNSEYPEIPTIPSSMEELSKTLERLPIDKLINNLLSTLKEIDELVNSPELKNTLISLSSTADTTKELAKK
ncbi:MAG: MCE family protein, partial [Nitrospirae bacterium]